jgi:predicted alpha/beta-fold hydrolase
LHKTFPELPPHNISLNTCINDIDEIYIAKRANFSSAVDYYKQCSSKKFVCDIKIPTKILLAEDDPIIAANELDDVVLPDNVDVLKTAYGGHIGFIGLNVFKDLRWMDNLIEKWVENILG